MSTKNQLQINNTQLSSLIQVLQDKSVGGGNVPIESVHICSVTINNETTVYANAFCTTYADDIYECSWYTILGGESLTLNNIPVSSSICIYPGDTNAGLVCSGSIIDKGRVGASHTYGYIYGAFCPDAIGGTINIRS